MVVLFLSTPTVRALEKPSVGEKAPEFTVKTQEESVSLEDYENETLILNFMNIGCEPCQREIDEWKKARNEISESRGVSFLSVETGSYYSREDLEKFKTDYQFEWPIIQAPGVAREYGVEGTPTTFVVENGQVKSYHVGIIHENELLSMIGKENSEGSTNDPDPSSANIDSPGVQWIMIGLVMIPVALGFYLVLRRTRGF